MDITIREIEEKDYLDVLSLGNNELDCKHNYEDITTHYLRVKDDNRYKTFVALLDDEVVGFISSVWSYEIGRELGFMHIVGLAVKSDMQNKGIGTKLIKHIEKYAKEKGITSIILNSGVQRTNAHAFYKNKGYDNRSWCFNKKL
ncbi:MAG: GNAT family N-acetyltransferase [Oscillospiraceae bacterium]|nr:GNAT family N-acetyltransferase [Oscillospiraceae bacterium]